MTIPIPPENTSNFIFERLHAGDFPSQILRELIQSTGLMKNDFAHELADAFPAQDRFDLLFSVWHWQELEKSEILDSLFDFRLIEKLVLGGEALPWTLDNCKQQIESLKPALAELARHKKILAEKTSSFESLKEKIAALSGTVKCIQALWDGDTHGWFIRLAVITFDGVAYLENPLITFSFGGDIRAFRGEVPPWPEAISAKEVGRQLAHHFLADFYFPSPDTPNDRCPSWLQIQSQKC